MLEKKVVSTKSPRRLDVLFPEVFARIEKDPIQKRIPYEKKEKWVNNDHSIMIATNKQCKTQTNHQFIHNGKETACHEQNQIISNCKFTREHGTRLHQKLKITDG
jgi:hypothetical protein